MTMTRKRDAERIILRALAGDPGTVAPSTLARIREREHNRQRERGTLHPHGYCALTGFDVCYCAAGSR